MYWVDLIGTVDAVEFSLGSGFGLVVNSGCDCGYRVVGGLKQGGREGK